MKKNILLFLLLLICTIGTSAQNNIAKDLANPNDNFYSDEVLIEALKDSLRMQNIDTFFVFLTAGCNMMNSYLIWIRNDTGFVLRISDSSVSRPKKIFFSFYRTVDFKLLVVKKNELVKAQLIPPLFPNSICEYLFIETKKIKGYVGYKKCSGLKLNSSQNNLRSNLLYTIKEDLLLLNDKWDEAYKYNRYPQ